MKATGALALLAALAVLAAPGVARAHPLSFAVLSLREEAHGEVALALDVSEGDGELPTRSVEVTLPARCRPLGPVSETRDAVSIARRARYACGPRGLDGAELRLGGLDGALQVAVHVERPGREPLELLADAARPVVRVGGRADRGETARVYGALGVAHILGGADHLLFVLALMLLARRARTLVATVTAFTLGHSVSLALAALGLVRVPAAPVEACIALSIVLVALEAARPPTAPRTRTARRPELVAAGFGLLHGLGFAGALARVGLPEGAVPLALFSFNVGVELGQLVFVVGVLVVAALAARMLSGVARRRGRVLVADAVGALACFWLLDRLASLGSS